MTKLFLGVALAGALMAGQATAQISSYKPGIADTGAGSFVVINKWNQRDEDIWCWAAKAALERGAGWRDRLQVLGVTSARQSSSRSEEISFTFRPTQEQQAQAKSGSSAVRGVGNNMSVSSANRRCTRELDLWP